MTKSPNLEVISKPASTSGASAGSSQDGLEKRRLPRLSLASEQFRLASNGKIFSVADMSIDGMALRVLDRNDLILFPVGARLEGTINLRREKHVVSALVRHLAGDLVGCQFLDVSAEVREALNRFLDPVALGQELRPLPSSSTETATLWYHGPSGTDLLLWRELDGHYSRVALFVLGSYVQWDETTGLVTGRFSPSHEKSEVRGAIRLDTLLLSPDPKPETGKLSVAKTLILSCSLPADVKKWCVRQLELSH